MIGQEISMKLFKKFMVELMTFLSIHDIDKDESDEIMMYFIGSIKDYCLFYNEKTNTINKIKDFYVTPKDEYPYKDIHLDVDNEKFCTIEQHAFNIRKYLTSTGMKTAKRFIYDIYHMKDVEENYIKNIGDVILYIIMTVLSLTTFIPDILFDEIMDDDEASLFDISQVSFVANTIANNLLSILSLTNNKNITLYPSVSLYVTKRMTDYQYKNCIFYKTICDNDEHDLYHVIIMDLDLIDIKKAL